jgi:hypothetical protein
VTGNRGSRMQWNYAKELALRYYVVNSIVYYFFFFFFFSELPCKDEVYFYKDLFGAPVRQIRLKSDMMTAVPAPSF